MAIKIDFLANLADLFRGTRRAADELEQFGEALADAADAGDNLGDSIDDGMRDAVRATDNAADRLERRLRDVATEARDAGRDAGNGMRRGMSDGLDELKDEAQQSGREAAASFNGGLEDVGDFAQETIANGLAGFGPIGLAAGVGLAAAVGTGLEAIRVDAEKTKEFVDAAFDDMAESGNSFVSDSFKRDAMAELLKNEGEVAKIREIAARTRVSEQTVMLAMVGDQQAMADLVAAENKAHDDKLGKLRDQSLGLADAERLVAEELRLHAEIVGEVDATAAGIESAAGKAALLNGVLGGTNKKLADAVRQIQDAAAATERLGQMTPTVSIKVDDSALEAALTRQQGRTISVNLAGQITRIGNQVWD